MADENENQAENQIDNPPENQNCGGRPATLDPAKRRKIIALLANGSSRRVAARVAGCSHSTIARTASRDADFAAELNAAEHNSEIEALRQIRKAAKRGRYWRAAAWLLERHNPRDFARRSPATLSEEDVINVAMRLADPVIYKMSDEEFDEFQDRLYEMVRALHESNELARYLPIPPPPPPVYVSHNKNGPQPESFAPRTSEGDDLPEEDGDCPDSRGGENGTDPVDAAEWKCFSRQTSPSPSSSTPLPKGFAPRSSNGGYESEAKLSPELLDAERLRASEIAAREIGN